MTETPTPPARVIIGLSGYQRAGKDTAGAALLADGFARASFADVIRDCLYRLDPIVPSHGINYRLSKLVDAYGWDTCKDRYHEVRVMLQRLGTDAGRNVLGDNVWVDAVMRQLDAGDVVFTDVRFPNEAQAIQAAGGFIVRVERPGFVPAEGAHVSETAMDGYPFDYLLHNTGTVEQLHEQVRLVVRSARSIA